jgi:transposase-like protein
VIVTYETIRQWCAKFGPVYAAGLRRRQPRPGDKWHLDCDVRSHALSGYVDRRVSRC